MIKFEEITYKTFGKCIKMSNDRIELVATLDFGPRVIHFSKLGGENMMKEDGTFSINKDEEAEVFAKAFGEDLGTWRIRGGHRLWASPEAMPRSYYPDNEPVQYQIDGNNLTLTPPPQRRTQQQHEMTITMHDHEGRVDVHHSITNLGPWPQKFAPWALSVLAQGGIEVIPMPDRPTGLLHNRKLTLWDYTKMNDPRVTWGDRYILLRQDPQATRAFKLGMDSQHGWAAYFNHGDVFLKKFDIVDGAEYPDGGMNFETYTNEHFLEMESLGVYKEVKTGEMITHHESWQMIPDCAFPGEDEASIADTLSPYI